MFRNTARCLDALFVIAGGLLAHWMRFSPLVALPDTERLMIAFNCVLVLLMFPGFGVYETWRGKPLTSMLARVAAAWLAVVAGALLLAFTLHRMDAVSRLWLAYSTLISGVLIIATKCAVHVALRSVRRRGMNFRTVAIVAPPGLRARCSPIWNTRRKRASNRSAYSIAASTRAFMRAPKRPALTARV